MTVISSIAGARIDHFSQLVRGLNVEFSSSEIAAIADHFADAEAIDFIWNSRASEAWIGACEACDEDAGSLDRIAILSTFRSRFHVAICLVDGEGDVHDMRCHSSFDIRWDAEDAFREMLG